MAEDTRTQQHDDATVDVCYRYNETVYIDISDHACPTFDMVNLLLVPYDEEKNDGDVIRLACGDYQQYSIHAAKGEVTIGELKHRLKEKAEQDGYALVHELPENFEQQLTLDANRWLKIPGHNNTTML